MNSRFDAVMKFAVKLIRREPKPQRKAARKPGPALPAKKPLVFDVHAPCPICGTFYSDPALQLKHYQRAHKEGRSNPWHEAIYYPDAVDVDHIADPDLESKLVSWSDFVRGKN